LRPFSESLSSSPFQAIIAVAAIKRVQPRAPDQAIIAILTIENIIEIASSLYSSQ